LPQAHPALSAVSEAFVLPDLSSDTRKTGVPRPLTEVPTR